MSNNKINEKDLQKLFGLILNTKVKVKDNKDNIGNINNREERNFGLMIEKLITADTMEHRVMEIGGIDAHKLTDPLWQVVENYMSLLYGSESTKIILWYIYDRIGPDGNIISLEEPNKKNIILKSTNDLWNYIKYKSPSSSN